MKYAKPVPLPYLKRFSPEFLVLVATLATSVLLGGSSRIDAWGLPIIYAVAGIGMAFSLVRISRAQALSNRAAWGFAAALGGLFIAHLIPLPPRIWSTFPGRDIIASIDAAAGLGPIYRPLSMDPARTIASAYALLPIIAVLLLGGQISAAERKSLAPVLIGLIGLSAIIGVLQITDGPGSSFYFYDQTGHTDPSGLFANRNHQAVFLGMLLPIMAAYIAPLIGKRSINRHLHMIWSGLLTLTVIALIIMTGSRAGTITMLIGAGSIPIIMREHGQRRDGGRATRLWIGATLTGAVLLLGFQVLIDNSPSVQRWMEISPGDDLRAKAIPTELGLLGHYFPTGSGFGSFPAVYEVAEPDDLLMYASFNHAHNDWMEFLIEGGLPALIWLGAALAAFIFFAKPLTAQPEKTSSRRVFGWAGASMILQAALASVADYPLRTPAIGVALAVAILWTFAIREKESGESTISSRYIKS
jgi:hypothetical protein